MKRKWTDTDTAIFWALIAAALIAFWSLIFLKIC
jgi:hypothetical protein